MCMYYFGVGKGGGGGGGGGALPPLLFGQATLWELHYVTEILDSTVAHELFPHPHF